MFVAVAALVLASCSDVEDKDSYGQTYVENFPVFTDAAGNQLNGTTITLALGEAFDYDYKATMGDNDVTADTEMSIYDIISGEYVDSIDTTSPGCYNVYYTGDTEHGLSSWTSTCSVYVYDPEVTTDIAGTYNVDLDKSLYYYGGWVSYNSEIARRGLDCTSATVTVTQLCPGIFQVNDLFGGWYAQVRGYGTNYNMSGIIMLNNDNSIDCLSSKVSAWGDSLDFLDDAKYDPETESLTWYFGYAGSIYGIPYMTKM